jgi:hypothetical protein
VKAHPQRYLVLVSHEAILGPWRELASLQIAGTEIDLVQSVRKARLLCFRELCPFSPTDKIDLDRRPINYPLFVDSIRCH